MRAHDAGRRQPLEGSQTDAGRSGHCALTQGPLRPTHGRRATSACPQDLCTARTRQRREKRKRRMNRLVRTERALQNLAECAGMVIGRAACGTVCDTGTQTEEPADLPQTPTSQMLPAATKKRLTGFPDNGLRALLCLYTAPGRLAAIPMLLN